MYMQIDKAGADDVTRRVDDLGTRCVDIRLHGGDLIARDEDVAHLVDSRGGIDDTSGSDEKSPWRATRGLRHRGYTLLLFAGQRPLPVICLLHAQRFELAPSGACHGCLRRGPGLDLTRAKNTNAALRRA